MKSPTFDPRNFNIILQSPTFFLGTSSTSFSSSPLVSVIIKSNQDSLLSKSQMVTCNSYELISVWTNSKFWPNRIPEYYSYAMFDRIEYTNNSDLIIRIIRIIRNTFERLKLGQIMPKKARNSSVSDNVCIR